MLIDQTPLNRSEGEIGGDLYIQSLKNFRQPEAGSIKQSSKKKANLSQTQGYLENVPNEGVKDPILDSGEGPITHGTRKGKTNQ